MDAVGGQGLNARLYPLGLVWRTIRKERVCGAVKRCVLFDVPVVGVAAIIMIFVTVFVIVEAKFNVDGTLVPSYCAAPAVIVSK